MKQCNKCHELLEESYFYKSSSNLCGYENQCKKCKNKLGAKRNALRLQDPNYRERVLFLNRKRYAEDKEYREAILAYKKREDVRKSNNNKRRNNEALKIKRKNKYLERYASDALYRHRLIARATQYAAKKLKIDVNFKLSYNLRTRVRAALKNNYKSGSAVRDLGCSIEELKKHLESKFQEGMSWSNYGFYGWHIDHIKPLSSFNLSLPEEFKQACHYSNLQPLWAKDNLSKGDFNENTI